MHGKTWPFTLKRDAHATSNYLSSCVVLNLYHLFLDATFKTPGRGVCTYSQFCLELTREIVTKHKE